MVGESNSASLNSRRLSPWLWVLVGCFWWPASVSGQHFLEGHWEGTLSQYDTLGNKTSWRVNLFLEKEGNELSGRFFVHLAPGEMIVTEVFGYLYEDRSIYLADREHQEKDLGQVPDFYRKYQLLSNRSIWNTTLEGFWQEIISGDPMDKKRKLGRMELKKLDNSKA